MILHVCTDYFAILIQVQLCGIQFENNKKIMLNYFWEFFSKIFVNHYFFLLLINLVQMIIKSANIFLVPRCYKMLTTSWCFCHKPLKLKYLKGLVPLSVNSVYIYCIVCNQVVCFIRICYFIFLVLIVVCLLLVSRCSTWLSSMHGGLFCLRVQGGFPFSCFFTLSCWLVKITQEIVLCFKFVISALAETKK